MLTKRLCYLVLIIFIKSTNYEAYSCFDLNVLQLSIKTFKENSHWYTISSVIPRRALTDLPIALCAFNDYIKNFILQTNDVVILVCWLPTLCKFVVTSQVYHCCVSHLAWTRIISLKQIMIRAGDISMIWTLQWYKLNPELNS